MDNITDKEYILRSFIELVRDENSRIVSQRLATSEEAKKLIDSISTAMVQNISTPYDLIEPLAYVHRNLASVKLPGDFEKVACGMQDAFSIVLDVPVQDEIAEVVSPQAGVLVVEEDEEKKDEKKEKKKKVKSMVLERLEKIAYSLGNKGQHEAAYVVERAMRELESTAAGEFPGSEPGANVTTPEGAELNVPAPAGTSAKPNQKQINNARWQSALFQKLYNQFRTMTGQKPLAQQRGWTDDVNNAWKEVGGWNVKKLIQNEKAKQGVGTKSTVQPPAQTFPNTPTKGVAPSKEFTEQHKDFVQAPSAAQAQKPVQPTNMTPEQKLFQDIRQSKNRTMTWPIFQKQLKDFGGAENMRKKYNL